MGDCTKNLTTTYRQHYKELPMCKRAVRVPPIKQEDETLISGHFNNNLLVNGKLKKSEIWPKSKCGVEEYEEFLKRLEGCKSVLHKMYYSCPGVDFALLESMLQDLEKTVYQQDYSPNEYLSKRRAKNICEFLSKESSGLKYAETTYRHYYNRIAELERYRRYMTGKLSKEKYCKKLYMKELKEIPRKTGRSTYISEYSEPARALMSCYNLKERPIDRYQYRRV